MMKQRKWFALLLVVVVLTVQFVWLRPAAATAGPSWTYLGIYHFDPNCAPGQLGIKTVVSGLTDPSYLYDTIVSQTGQIYTDALSVQSHVSGNQLFWAPQQQNDRGMRTTTNPLTPNVPATVKLTLRKVTTKAILWQTVLSVICNTGVAQVVFSGVPSSPDLSAPGAVTFFGPGDSRVDPLPGDRLAIWCNTTTTPPTIVVYGVNDDKSGFFLTLFKNADLLKAGPKGITQEATNGTVSMMQDGNGHFYAAWNDGQAHPSDQGDFAKSFTCAFPQ
jgi:hypothetical protein